MTVTAILIGLWHSDIAKAANVNGTPYPEDNVKLIRELTSVLNFKALPSATIASLVTLTFLPDAVEICLDTVTILLSMGLAGWRYDTIKTAYCLTNAVSATLAVYAWYAVLRLRQVRARLAR